MGIYIPNMEMPTSCEDCPMCHSNAEYDYAYCCVSSAETSGNKIPSGCPLIPVPPHGRLIDADALLKDITPTDEDEDNGAKLLMNVFCQVVKTRPTIIPAEEADHA